MSGLDLLLLDAEPSRKQDCDVAEPLQRESPLPEHLMERRINLSLGNRTTSECFGTCVIPRINRGVDVLWRDPRKEIGKLEPAWHGGITWLRGMLNEKANLRAAAEVHGSVS